MVTRYNTPEPRDVVMWSVLAATAASMLTTIGLVIAMAVAFTWPLLVGAIAMAGIALGLGFLSAEQMKHAGTKTSVFGSTAEAELLTSRQKKTLKAARGEVLMKLAMLDVENEKENIDHRRLENAGDMSKPPHKTSFTNPDGSPKQLGRGRDY